MSEAWLSIIEYAREHQLSDMTVRRHIRTGRLEAVLKDGKYFIPAHAQVGKTYVTGATRHPPASLGGVGEDLTPRTWLHQPASPHTAMNAPRLAPPKITPVQKATNDDSATLTGLRSCLEAAVAKLEKTEKILEERYDQQLQVMNEKLRTKEVELGQVRQDVQDLELLVKMMESKFT